jgi:hypothetical protein
MCKEMPFTYAYMLLNTSVDNRKIKSINFFRRTLDILILLDDLRPLVGKLDNHDNAEEGDYYN